MVVVVLHQMTNLDEGGFDLGANVRGVDVKVIAARMAS
jgi:hypothetical protein